MCHKKFDTPAAVLIVLFERLSVIQCRRVRFDLPPTDGSEVECRENGVENTNSWVRANSRRANAVPAITSVTVVSTTTSVRQRAHTVGKYVRGTLSPTAGVGIGAGSPSGPSPALLRAARDADDLVLKDLLRRAALVGVPEKELNAQDSSGRVSLIYKLPESF